MKDLFIRRQDAVNIAGHVFPSNYGAHDVLWPHSTWQLLMKISHNIVGVENMCNFHEDGPNGGRVAMVVNIGDASSSGFAIT